MTKNKTKTYTKPELISKLKQISAIGWIPNARRGNAGGVGNTLEDLLGIEENNLPIPNAAEWELKAQRINTTSLTTLFHTEPSPRAIRFVPQMLLPKYGWPHEEAGHRHPKGEMSFRQTIHGQLRSDRGFMVVIDQKQRKILISFDAKSVDPRHGDWLKSVKKRVGLCELNPQPYWGFDDLEHKALEKLLGMKTGFARGELPPKPRKFSERVVLLDNIRLNPGEKKNDLKFAKRLAAWGDYYINDAFAVSHREHASIVFLPKLLPHEAGPLLKAEVENLSRFFKPNHPFLLILAGKKFETKEPLIRRFLKSADAIFIGGAIGNTFLVRRGIDVGKSKVENMKIPKNVIWNNKILLPEDWVIKKSVILDAGPKTVKTLGELAKASRFVLWNGTLGLCEKGFEYGTKTLAKELGKSKAYKVVGGGDTVAAIRKFKLEKNFDFISTGGGAMLEFLAKGALPGIEALKKK